jgi:hypothetical protein
VTRLELKQVRVCSQCGRGRAELESPDGDRLEVPLDAPRAHDLSGHRDEVGSVMAFVLTQLTAAGAQPAEVVLDLGPRGVRALLSYTRDGESDVLACTAQEGIELAVRGELRIYATDQALATGDDRPAATRPRNTVH